MRAEVDTAAGTLALIEVHRFATPTVSQPDGLHWDAPRLFDEVLAGFGKAAATAPPRQPRDRHLGRRLRLARRRGRACSACPSTIATAAPTASWTRSSRRIGREALYDRTGIQFLPFNTLYQVVAEQRDAPDRLRRAATLLTMPDLLHHWLSGARGVEFTNATTTQMLDWRTGTWDVGAAAGARHPDADAGADHRARHAPGHAAAGVRRARAAARRRAGDRPCLSRHRIGRRVGPVRRRRRVPQFGHMVAARHGDQRAHRDEGGTGAQLHQRGRRRRHHAAAAQHHRPVGAGGLPSRMARRGAGVHGGGRARRRRAAAGLPVRDRPGRHRLPSGA